MFLSLRTSLSVYAQCWIRMVCSSTSHRSWLASHHRDLLKYYHKTTVAVGPHSSRNISSTRCLCQDETSNSAKDDEINLEKNPFFLKYKNHLQHLKSTSPERYEEKLQQLKEKLKSKWVKEMGPKKTSATVRDTDSKNSRAAGVKFKSLDSIMKLELVKDKSAQELEQLWKEYHSNKECIYAVIKEEDYLNLVTKSKIASLFIYPLPREDGYEFLLSQIAGNEVYFTQLAMYQRLKENAPVCLMLRYYTEFQNAKGIVLMNGEYFSTIINLQEALCLVNQMTLYYGSGSAQFNLVRLFNHNPDKFNYQDLIDNLQNIHQLMKS